MSLGGRWSWHSAGDRAGCDIPVPLADAVPKPTVRAIVNGDNPEHCEVTLECSVQMEDVTYEWMPPSRVMTTGSNSTLPLSFNPSLETYTCRASNPVSSSSAQLTRRHPCSWTGTGCTRWQNLGGMGGRWSLGVPGVRALFPWAGGGRTPPGKGTVGLHAPALQWSRLGWSHVLVFPLPPAESSAVTTATKTSMVMLLGHLLLLFFALP